MAKTFDNISEASSTNYLFLFAQRTLALQDESPTPPPLNALGLPCKAIRMLCQKVKAPAPDKSVSEQATTSSAAETLEASAGAASAETAEVSPSSPSPLVIYTSSPPRPGEVTRGEETPLIDKIAPALLAGQITEYILDHQDDAAQEDRWRTTMKREMSKSFRKVETDMQSMQVKFDEMDEKMEQRVKSIMGLITKQQEGEV